MELAADPGLTLGLQRRARLPIAMRSAFSEGGQPRSSRRRTRRTKPDASRRDRGRGGHVASATRGAWGCEHHRPRLRRWGDGEAKSEPLLAPGMLVLFIALIACFTAWGIAQDLTTPMVAGFKRIFDMSTFQASLVQLAYFGAYFLLALPAAFINQRFGYKTGILTGLALAALGAFLFYPASKIMTYEAFLVALFAMAAGCSILETSANPYVISLGPEATATRRLNLAQAFNPVGTNIGVLLASTLILPKLADPVDIGVADAGPAAHDPRGRARRGDGPVPRPRLPAAPHRRRDREPEGAADRRGVPRRRPARGRDARAVRRAVAQQALPLRRRRPVLQRRGAGVHVDVPDPVRGAGAGRQPREGRRLPAGQPAGLPRSRASS